MGHLYYLTLHIIVFIWGFTGILGDLIQLESPQLVWYRMGVAAITLFAYNFLMKEQLTSIFQDWKKLVLASLFVALHWIFFFGSIKASNISIGVVCMSTQAFMLSLIQPLLKRVPIKPHEILLGVIVVGAMIMIFGFEYKYKTGILLGLISSLFAVLFTILNSGFVKEYKASVISNWEMLIGFGLLSLYLCTQGQLNDTTLSLKGNDLLYILLLAIVCTAVAFPVSVYIMKKLSAFTVSLSVNLEPVYTILLALLMFGEKEKMSIGFYAGACLLILTVVAESTLFNKK